MRAPPVSGAVLGDKGIRYQGHREGSFFQVIPGVRTVAAKRVGWYSLRAGC